MKSKNQKLITKTQIKFDFVDLIKMLFGSVAEIQTTVWIPATVSTYDGSSSVHLLRGSKSKFEKDLPDTIHKNKMKTQTY